MAVNISKQLEAIVNSVINVQYGTSTYYLVQDDYELGDLGGYLIDIITSTFGANNRMPIYYALQNISAVEVTEYTYTNYTEYNYGRYTHSSNTFYLTDPYVLMYELDENFNRTSQCHFFTTASDDLDAQAMGQAATYAKNHPDVNFEVIYAGEQTNGNYFTDKWKSVTNLVKMHIYRTHTNSYQNAFYGCTGLREFSCYDGLNAISIGMFDGCSNLEHVSLSPWTNTINGSAFQNCYKLHTIDSARDPYTGNKVGFYHGASTIGNYAFQNCYSLKNIEDGLINNRTTSIGNYAFYRCYSIESFPDLLGLLTIGNYAFADSHKLQSIGALPAIRGINERAFEGCTSLRYVGAISTTSSTSTPTIYTGAFSGCVRLRQISAKHTFTLSSSGSLGTFEGCTSLTNASVYDILRYVATPSMRMFANCRAITRVTIDGDFVTTSLPVQCFYQCVGLTDITISGNVTIIGGYCFCKCVNLSSVTIGNSVTSIDSSAFEDCYNLESIDIPSSVTSIGANAFKMTSGSESKLQTITVHATEGSITGAPWGAPSGCTIVWAGA